MIDLNIIFPHLRLVVRRGRKGGEGPGVQGGAGAKRQQTETRIDRDQPHERASERQLSSHLPQTRRRDLVLDDQRDVEVDSTTQIHHPTNPRKPHTHPHVHAQADGSRSLGLGSVLIGCDRQRIWQRSSTYLSAWPPDQSPPPALTTSNTTFITRQFVTPTRTFKGNQH